MWIHTVIENGKTGCVLVGTENMLIVIIMRILTF